MPDWIVKYWVQWLFGLIATALGILAGYVRTKMRRQKAIEEGVRAMLHDRIHQAHAQYVGVGYILPADLENIDILYGAYHALGGNGTITTLREEMHDLPHTYPL